MREQKNMQVAEKQVTIAESASQPDSLRDLFANFALIVKQLPTF